MTRNMMCNAELNGWVAMSSKIGVVVSVVIFR